MTFSSIQSLGLTLALAAAGMAQAATIDSAPASAWIVNDTIGSSGDVQVNVVSAYSKSTFEFSNGTGVFGGAPTTSIGGLVGASNVTRSIWTAVDGAQVDNRMVPVVFRPYRARGIIDVSTEVTGLSVNSQAGHALNVQTSGGAQQDVAYLEGVADGGRVVIKNLRFDLGEKMVYADLYGQALDVHDVLGPVKTSLNTALWRIGTVTGPTTLPPAAWLASLGGDFSKLEQLGYSLSAPSNDEPSRPLYAVGLTNMLGGLKMTDAGFDFFASSLGLTPGSTGYTTLQGVNGQSDGWGSISSTVYFRPVPEPGTWALMTVGLMGIVWMTRRRQL